MAAQPLDPRGPGEDDASDPAEVTRERPSEHLARSEDLLGEEGSECRKWLAKRFDQIARGFEDQADRSNHLDDWWNCYNCRRDDNGYYNGEAELYVPTIHDAVDALVTRYSNQLMPQSGRYVEATSTDGQQPYEITSLVNHYIGRAKFKSKVLAPLLRNGIIEGQYNLYPYWGEVSRTLVSRETRGVLTEGPKPGQPPVAVDTAALEIVDISEEEIIDAGPAFEVLHDADVLVIPSTADSIDDALEMGGCVTIVRRYSKEALRGLEESEDLDLDSAAQGQDSRDRDGEPLIFSVTPEMAGLKDIEKHLARNVGIKARGKHAILFEVWQKVPLSEKGSFDEDGDYKLCKTWYALSRQAVGLKRNPLWNDRCPLLSEPVKKMAGVFKGPSLIEPLAQLQYESNDAANERADVDHMSAMPIIVRKASDGNTPLLIAKGAIWDFTEQPPGIITFPDLGPRANGRILAARQLIFQSLSVNPAMLPQQSGSGAKRNQAEVAMEQQVDLLSAAEGTEVVVALLTEMTEALVDMDHQYRDRELTIRQFGELGVSAEMVSVPPYKSRTQYSFMWVGAVQMRMNAAMAQNGTAFINMLRGQQDQLAKSGLELNLGGILEYQAAALFGPTIARTLLRDLRHELAVDPEVENKLLTEGHEVPTNIFDNDQMHLQSHSKAMQENGDPHGTYRVHIQWTMKQMQMKSAAQQQAMMQQGGAPGVPGQPPRPGMPPQAGGPGVPAPPGGGPRIAGTPPGAVPAQPRMMKAPPGRIPQTMLPRMGAVVPPRRF
jgi:hypothetical protein